MIIGDPITATRVGVGIKPKDSSEKWLKFETRLSFAKEGCDDFI